MLNLRHARTCMLALVCLGCQSVFGFEEFSGGSPPDAGGEGGSSGGEGGQHADACHSQPSPGIEDRGPQMVGIGLPDGDCLWMDETEVTVAQYQSFLDAAPSTRVSGCEWNADLSPSCGAGGTSGSSGDDIPVSCVDFCDAAEFCHWADKRLCSGEGTAATDPGRSEWYAVCSDGGAKDYPYGDTYVDDACNDADRSGTGCDAVDGTCSLVSVGSLRQCKTGHGVADLLGNVAEWVDECNGDADTDECRTRGGGVNDADDHASCGSVLERTRDFAGFALGFRCCAGGAARQ